MKVLTLLGTRPEIIRLSRIIPKLDALCDHVLVHTGQNYDAKLNDVFFDELGVRTPDRLLGIRESTFGAQIGRILALSEEVMEEELPDRVLLLGDTNSALSAIVAKRLGIPVYHMEAGNRCFDDRVPEEVNRRIIDHSSDVLMPYTERSRSNLLREGIEGNRIFVTGNPIAEVLRYYANKISESRILDDLGLYESYCLVTMHRQENVDDKLRLRHLLDSLGSIRRDYELPVVCSVHPRTRNRLEEMDKDLVDNKIHFLQPFGLFDFVKLEQQACFVLTDSGTVQEECCIMGIPNITIRDSTERPETIECGSNILSGVLPEDIMRCVRIIRDNDSKWLIPPEYAVDNVSQVVSNKVLGF